MFGWKLVRKTGYFNSYADLLNRIRNTEENLKELNMVIMSLFEELLFEYPGFNRSYRIRKINKKN